MDLYHEMEAMFVKPSAGICALSFPYKHPFSSLQLDQEFLWIFGYRLCPIKLQGTG